MSPRTKSAIFQGAKHPDIGTKEHDIRESGTLCNLLAVSSAELQIDQHSQPGLRSGAEIFQNSSIAVVRARQTLAPGSSDSWFFRQLMTSHPKLF